MVTSMPPQLLYMLFKAQKLTNENGVNVTLAETVVAPRAVRERIAKRKAEQEKEVYNVPASSLPNEQAKSPSPFDGYEASTLKTHLRALKASLPQSRLRLQARINQFKALSDGILGHTEGGDEIYM